MKAVRISPAPADGPQYSAENPAPASAIQVVADVPKPQPSKPGQVLVQVKASTVVRDCLTWPELYAATSPSQLGNDFAGVVTAVHDAGSEFKPGDDVYGMMDAARGGAWAEYLVASTDEVSPKPAKLSWAEAASLPLSAMTADQALFEQTGLQSDAEGSKKKVLITGASGAVGTLLVQLAIGAGYDVTAATSSNSRNTEYLGGIGAEAIVEYEESFKLHEFDAVIDTVGGEVLRQCWQVLKSGGSLVTIDSASWDFINQHQAAGIAREDVKAKFFIVEPSRRSLMRVSEAVESGKLRPIVAKAFPMAEARAAYELGNSRAVGRGKVILEM